MVDLGEETPKTLVPVPEKNTVVEKMDDSIDDLKDISLIDEAAQPEQQEE